jgi:hypothetical protein
LQLDTAPTGGSRTSDGSGRPYAHSSLNDGGKLQYSFFFLIQT